MADIIFQGKMVKNKKSSQSSRMSVRHSQGTLRSHNSTALKLFILSFTTVGFSEFFCDIKISPLIWFGFIASSLQVDSPDVKDELLCLQMKHQNTFREVS